MVSAVIAAPSSKCALSRAAFGDARCPGLAPRRRSPSYTIFEGTSEISRLVVARAVSGLRTP
jgi:hypothetical protein